MLIILFLILFKETDTQIIIGEKTILACTVVEYEDAPVNETYWTDGVNKFFNDTQDPKYQISIIRRPSFLSELKIYNVQLLIVNLTKEDTGTYVCHYKGRNETTINLILDEIDTNVTVSPDEVIKESLYDILSTINIKINVTGCCAEQNVPADCFDPCIGNLGHKEACEEYKDRIDMCIINGKDHRKCCEERMVDDECIDLCAHSSSDELYRQCKRHLPDIFECIQEGHERIPSPPSFVIARAMNSTTVEVRWEPPTHNPGRVQTYVIVYSKITLPTDTESDTIQHHSSFIRDYTTSETFVKQSSVQQPFTEPFSLNSSPTTSSVLVAEDVAHDDTIVMDPTTYIELPKLIMPMKNTTAIRLPWSLFVYNVTGLEPGSAYEIYMLAISNENGSSLPSDLVEVFTPSLPDPTTATVTDQLGGLEPGEGTIQRNVTRSLQTVIKCCRSTGIPDNCVDSLCKIHGSSTTASNSNFVKAIGNCAPHFQASMRCIIDGRNHTQCCIAGKIPSKCYGLCDGTRDMLDDFNQATCLFDISTIISCIRQGYEILPSPPNALKTLFTGAFLITLDWAAPSKNADMVVSYTLYYRPIEYSSAAETPKSDEYEDTINKPIFRDYTQFKSIEGISKMNHPPYTFLSLVPVTWYEIFVVANALNGSSLPSHTLRVRTKPLGELQLEDVITDTPPPGDQKSSEDSGTTDVGPKNDTRLSPNNNSSSPGLSYDFDSENREDGPSSFRIEVNENTLNERAQNCCRKSLMPTDCVSKICRYDIDLTSLPTFAALSSCSQHFAKALVCLADERDHAQCCRENGIIDTCSMFCRSQVPVDINLSLTCLPHASAILACFKKGIRKLPRPPSQLKLIDAGTSSLKFKWSAPDLTFIEPSSPVSINSNRHTTVESPDTLSYKVVYIPMKTYYRPDVFPTSIKVNDTEIEIGGLKSNTTYRLYVLAINKHGSSLPSYIITATTLDNSEPLVLKPAISRIPPMPREIVVKEVGVDYIRLEWGYQGQRSNKDAIRPIDWTYIVRYHEAKEDDPDYPALNEYLMINVSRPAYNFTALKPHTLYKFFITSENRYMESLKSEILTIKTRHQSAPRAYISVYPHESNITEGTTVTLNCRAEGYPVPQISWYIWKDKFKSPIWHDENFTLNHIHHSASGQYKCVARNGLLPKGKDFVHLTIAFAPLVIAKSKEYSARTYHSAELRCVIEAYPLNSKDVFWYKSGKLIPRGGNYTNHRYDLVRMDRFMDSRIPRRQQSPNSTSVLSPKDFSISHGGGNEEGGGDQDHGDNLPNAYTYITRLILKNLEIRDFTDYMCQVQNRLGKDQDVVKLVRIRGIPPSRLDSGQDFSSQNSVDGDAESVVNKTLAPYMPNVTACCERLNVKHMCRPACYYNLNVNAFFFNSYHNRNANVKNNDSGQITKTTTPVYNDIQIMGSTYMLTCLSELPKLVYCAADGRNHEQCCRRNNVPWHCLRFCEGTVPPYGTPNLQVCLVYSQAIIDCYYNGSVNIPSVPVNVRASLVHGDEILLRWDRPVENGFNVDYYIIYHREANQIKWNKTRSKATTVRFMDLKVNTEYIFQIEAHNDHGWSHRSPEFTIKTHSHDGSIRNEITEDSGIVITESSKKARTNSRPATVALTFIGMILLLFVIGIALFVFYKKNLTAHLLSFDNPGYDKEHILEDMRAAKYNEMTNHNNNNHGFYDDISEEIGLKPRSTEITIKNNINNNNHNKNDYEKPLPLPLPPPTARRNNPLIQLSPDNTFVNKNHQDNNYSSLYDNHKLQGNSSSAVNLSSPTYDYISTVTNGNSSTDPVGFDNVSISTSAVWYNKTVSCNQRLSST